MDWRIQRPTEAGFYWHRDHPGTEEEHITVVAYHVDYDGEGSCGFTRLGQNVVWEGICENLDGEFCGPITPPAWTREKPTRLGSYWYYDSAIDLCGVGQVNIAKMADLDTEWFRGLNGFWSVERIKSPPLPINPTCKQIEEEWERDKAEAGERIRDLVSQMRRIAAKVGPMHAFWDPIFDMEQFLKGMPTTLGYSGSVWIAYAQQLLSDQEFTWTDDGGMPEDGFFNRKYIVLETMEIEVTKESNELAIITFDQGQEFSEPMAAAFAKALSHAAQTAKEWNDKTR